MATTIDYEPNEICVLRISSVLHRSEFGAEQNALARRIDIGAKPRLLAILENFKGWERGANARKSFAMSSADGCRPFGSR